MPVDSPYGVVMRGSYTNNGVGPGLAPDPEKYETDDEKCVVVRHH
jgi:hypothetical protein